MTDNEKALIDAVLRMDQGDDVPRCRAAVIAERVTPEMRERATVRIRAMYAARIEHDKIFEDLAAVGIVKWEAARVIDEWRAALKLGGDK